jgi:hypothetical protein
MAQMFPNHLRPDTRSHAERVLYESFREQLPDSYLVFHSVAWQQRKQKGAFDGEADFVIAHPDYGIMVLEAKAGTISYDGVTDTWYQNAREMQDPFKQAMRSKYSLRDLLAPRARWRSMKHIPLAHAVAFTDIKVSPSVLKPDAHRDAILTFDHLDNVQAWVEHCFATSLPRAESPGQAAIDDLRDLLSPTIQLERLLGAEIAEHEKEFVQATDAQFRVLQAFNRARRLTVSGCAGSGKTLLAAEKARRLSRQHPEMCILLTCYNVNLAEYLAASLTGFPQIIVRHFHGLCSDLAKKAGQPLPASHQQPQSFFDVEMPNRLIAAAAELHWHVDAVIVDEGQDFHQNWWEALQLLLREPDDGFFYIFFDDNQNLYQSSNRIPGRETALTLTENCRNTQNIHEFFMKYYRGELELSAQGPRGQSVELLSYSDRQSLKKLLQQKLNHLVNLQSVEPEDIVVLTSKSLERSVLPSFGMLGNFHLMDQPGASGDIFYTTIHQFKGLERHVVILAELDRDLDDHLLHLMYVGASRAKSHLIVLKHEGAAL